MAGSNPTQPEPYVMSAGGAMVGVCWGNGYRCRRERTEKNKILWVSNPAVHG
jgi:hypothetical protein